MDNMEVGKKFHLYMVDNTVGKGLPLLLPYGATIRRVLERFIVDEEIKRGYQHVITPDIAKKDLYKVSGHWPLYKDSMCPAIELDEQQYLLRAMSCPHHITIYKHRPRSYNELPLRYAELAKLYRNEKSGELHGLIRVRAFTLADAHIFCTPEQVDSEFKNVMSLIKYCLDTMGVEGYWFRLSLRDEKKDKYLGNDAMWKNAEGAIKKALDSLGLKYVEAKGEAAFYGPKLDVQVKNSYGKEDTLITNQIDFQLPQKFGLEYIDKDNKPKQPVMIHRSSIGSIERTLAFLFEKYQGAFPLWLAPVQVKVISMNKELVSYSKEIEQKLMLAGLRAEGDYRNSSMGKRIRAAETMKVPYVVVIGQKEKEAGTLAIRPRGAEPKFGIKFDDFVKDLKKLEVSKK